MPPTELTVRDLRDEAPVARAVTVADVGDFLDEVAASPAH